MIENIRVQLYLYSILYIYNREDLLKNGIKYSNLYKRSLDRTKSIGVSKSEYF
jgi:hypothetical protein